MSTFVCPTNYVIYFKVGDNWIDPIPAAQDAALTFYKTDGFLDVETSDYSLDSVTWELRVT